mgnify:CR=1 FL=1
MSQAEKNLSLPREHHRHYISASNEDIDQMIEAIGESSLESLFDHIPESIRFRGAPAIPEELEYDEVAEKMKGISEKNNVLPSFIGDGLPNYRAHPIVPAISSLRKLTTSYTPYQPERSQGTLISHWIYQSLLSKLTGFEAVNASLYERSTALYEACACAIRLKRNADTVLVASTIHAADMEVLSTLTADNDAQIEYVPFDPETGLIEPATLANKIKEMGERIAAVAFPQVNHLGLLENVDALTETAREAGIYSIALIDPMLLATGGLKPPASYAESGCDIIVGEAQHLAIAPNFGGPGLGLFGVRHNSEVKNMLRATPGRFVGKAQDSNGADCFVQVLSTREQHIRKDKATSNICSNQAFLATLAGATLLARGEEGMQACCLSGYHRAREFIQDILPQTGCRLFFSKSPFFNEVVIQLPESAAECIQKARENGLHVGVDVSDRLPGEQKNLLKLSFSDRQEDNDMKRLCSYLSGKYPATSETPQEKIEQPIPSAYLRSDKLSLPSPGESKVWDYYQRMAELNVSPDQGLFPLGSCTMKYNPQLNDWAATLPGFSEIHPQTPLEDAQGCLEVLHEVQEWFVKITGLAGVTTQPVAGAQGELTGLKLFQAYHRDHAPQGALPRDVILIPKSAHGTNFATAITAGYPTRTVDGVKVGIVLLEADDTGIIHLDDLEAKIAEYGERISGIMITNPNTGGVFESAFKEIAERIHRVGGLVYMDGANMNAISGWVNLGAMGVDAVHNNLHKTWSIPHGGGGPGDAIVAVSEKLVDYLPGYQIRKEGDQFVPRKPSNSIGSFHRHWGNFAHKARAYTYLLRLGREGVRRIASYSVLSARYLHRHLAKNYSTLPLGADDVPRMHEFILTLSDEDFGHLEKFGIARAAAMPNIGKLFLDFGYHAPTVAFPEPLGLMIEPTETYSKAELDRFIDAVNKILEIVREFPEIVRDAPHFTPVSRIDEVSANRQVQLSESLEKLPTLHEARMHNNDLLAKNPDEIKQMLIEHQSRMNKAAS